VAIDFFEKEMLKLRGRFNRFYGERMVCDLKIKQLSLLAIIRAGMIAKSLRDQSDPKKTADLTREFFQIRQTMNQFFDFMESKEERRSDEKTSEKRSVVAEGEYSRKQGGNL
jgi:hypothetical protein